MLLVIMGIWLVGAASVTPSGQTFVGASGNGLA